MPAKGGWTALQSAASGGHVEATRLLLQHGSDPSATDKGGWTALHWAVVSAHVDLMALLLDGGSDLRAIGQDGMTALHLAADNGYATATAFLLHRGADPSATNKQNETARDVAILRDFQEVALVIDSFIDRVSDEWRPLKHMLYPLPFRSAVATVLALWSWNPSTHESWHHDSPFLCLSLELLFEVFIWVAADIASRGYVVVPDPARLRKGEINVETLMKTQKSA